MRIEKGIFSLANLIKNKRDISLTIVGAEKKTTYNINQRNIKVKQPVLGKDRSDKIYENIKNLEKIDNIKEIFKLISNPIS